MPVPRMELWLCWLCAKLSSSLKLRLKLFYLDKERFPAESKECLLLSLGFINWIFPLDLLFIASN